MRSTNLRGSSLAALFLVALAVTLAMAGPPSLSPEAQRGQYLVTAGGCGDCHTPMKMGTAGPEPDMAFMLAGHPQALVMPPAPTLPPGPWMGTFSATNTAWAGPWGVSFTANLTPDPETGLGPQWSDRVFIGAIRNGRYMGKGRPLLPPMPFPAMASLTDADLSAMFAYLRTVAPIRNQVPDPILAGEPESK